MTSVHRSDDVRVFYKECCSLKANGFSVVLIAPHGQDEVIDGIKIVAVKRQTSRILRWIITCSDVYRKAKKEDASIYHFHDPELMLVGWLLAAQSKKVIYDVHEDIPRQILSKGWIPLLLRKIISKVVQFIESVVVKKYCGVITTMESIRDRYLKITSAPVINISNYPRLQECFRSYPSSMKHEKSPPQLCYIGGISEMRGVKQMIAAAYKANIPLCLAGNFWPAKLEAELKADPAWSIVDYRGFLSRSEAGEVMMNSVAGMVLFHPVYHHLVSLPNKLFEYMTASLPVIASNFNLWRPVVENNNCGICVDPLNIDEIVTAINYIIENSTAAKTMGDNGHQLVTSSLNWDRESKKLIDFYREILC